MPTEQENLEIFQAPSFKLKLWFLLKHLFFRTWKRCISPWGNCQITFAIWTGNAEFRLWYTNLDLFSLAIFFEVLSFIVIHPKIHPKARIVIIYSHSCCSEPVWLEHKRRQNVQTTLFHSIPINENFREILGRFSDSHHNLCWPGEKQIWSMTFIIVCWFSRQVSVSQGVCIIARSWKAYNGGFDN